MNNNQEYEQDIQQNQQLIEENEQILKQQQGISQETVDSMFNTKDLENKKKPWYYKFDIFQFIPVPKTRPVSTTKSLIASIIFLTLIVSFCTYTFVMFLTNNSPKVSQFFIPLDDRKFEAPQFAVGFFEGDKVLLPQDLSDGEYFTIKIYQQYRKIDEEPDKQPILTGTGEQCAFPWLDSVKQNTKYMICPLYDKIKPQKDNDNQKVVIQGNAGFNEYMYPQILVEWCNPKDEDFIKTGKKCASEQQIKKKAAGGRIQLYLKNAVQKNYATGEVADYTFEFTMYYYFLVPGQYIRYAVDYQLQAIKQLPDMFTSFTTTDIVSFWIKDQIFYPSKNVFDPYRAFSVWLTLNPNVQRIDYVYDTLFVVGPMMGAFCSVMFTTFSFIFIAYNAKQFYSKNQKWNNIADTMEKLKIINSDEKPRQISMIQPEQKNQQRSQQQSNIELINSLNPQASQI